jgi:hypothetical protein
VRTPDALRDAVARHAQRLAAYATRR